MEPEFHGGKIKIKDLFDLLHAVNDGVSVHMQQFRRLGVVHAGNRKGTQRREIVLSLPLVILHQAAHQRVAVVDKMVFF